MTCLVYSYVSEWNLQVFACTLPLGCCSTIYCSVWADADFQTRVMEGGDRAVEVLVGSATDLPGRRNTQHHHTHWLAHCGGNGPKIALQGNPEKLSGEATAGHGEPGCRG